VLLNEEEESLDRVVHRAPGDAAAFMDQAGLALSPPGVEADGLAAVAAVRAGEGDQ